MLLPGWHHLCEMKEPADEVEFLIIFHFFVCMAILLEVRLERPLWAMQPLNIWLVRWINTNGPFCHLFTCKRTVVCSRTLVSTTCVCASIMLITQITDLLGVNVYQESLLITPEWIAGIHWTILGIFIFHIFWKGSMMINKQRPKLDQWCSEWPLAIYYCWWRYLVSLTTAYHWLIETLSIRKFNGWHCAIRVHIKIPIWPVFQVDVDALIIHSLGC